MLRPINNKFRSCHSLAGLWDFQMDPDRCGEKNRWFKVLPNPRSIPVPSSWNELFDDARDYLDESWYLKKFFFNAHLENKTSYLRFDSANYFSCIWLNGVGLGEHEGGHLPFEYDVSDKILNTQENVLAVSVENRLFPSRVPPGGADGWKAGAGTSMYPDANYDFFPYCGLHRDVFVCTKPVQCIEDIKFETLAASVDSASVCVRVVTNIKEGQIAVRLTIGGEQTEVLRTITDHITEIAFDVSKPQLWSPEDPALYDLNVELFDSSSAVVDEYLLYVGIRTVSVTKTGVSLNGKDMPLKGFGKHEDSDFFGRGLNLPVLVKDHELMKWVGANSFRTSHYPYAEEWLDLADRDGLLVISETPNVGLYFDGDEAELGSRQKLSERFLAELIDRDKNHPSVIAWSVANEPSPPAIYSSFAELEKTEENQLRKAVGKSEVTTVVPGTQQLKDLIDVGRSYDATRPVIVVNLLGAPDQWLDLGDMVCITRYWGWYVKSGRLDEAAELLEKELETIHKKTGKPIFLAEFGADTLAGCHAVPSEMFSEEYQVELLKIYLDLFEKKDYICGVHIWNFADFKTSQAVLRVGGMNLKGVFTRDRKPKMAAKFLHDRWSK